MEVSGQHYAPAALNHAANCDHEKGVRWFPNSLYGVAKSQILPYGVNRILGPQTIVSYFEAHTNKQNIPN
jgi:hypothetical protein